MQRKSHYENIVKITKNRAKNSNAMFNNAQYAAKILRYQYYEIYKKTNKKNHTVYKMHTMQRNLHY